MKPIITILIVGMLCGLGLAFDFTTEQANYDEKGKAKNIILEIEGITATIFNIPQTDKKVEPENVLIFSLGVGAPMKKPDSLPGTPVVWLSTGVSWALKPQPTVTVRFPKDTTLDFSRKYSCYMLSEGVWKDASEVRVDAKDYSLSFTMKALGTFALSYK